MTADVDDQTLAACPDAGSAASRRGAGHCCLPGPAPPLCSVLLIPCTALTGWVLHNEILKRVLPGLVVMNPVTALCFVLAGLSLWLRWSATGEARRSPVGQTCAVVDPWPQPAGADPILCLAGISPLTRCCSPDALNWQPDGGDDGAWILSCLAARCCCWTCRRACGRPAQLLALVAGLIALAALIGYCLQHPTRSSARTTQDPDGAAHGDGISAARHRHFSCAPRAWADGADRRRRHGRRDGTPPAARHHRRPAVAGLAASAGAGQGLLLPRVRVHHLCDPGHHRAVQSWPG